MAASLAGSGSYGTSSDSAVFTVQKEDTALTLADAVASKREPAVAAATLTEADGAALAGRTITFWVEQKVRGQTPFVEIGTAATGADGIARLEVPTRYISNSNRAIRATFAGDVSFLASTGDAFAYRQ